MGTSSSNHSSSEPDEELNVTYSYITGKTREFGVRNYPFNIRISKINNDIARIYFVASDPETGNSDKQEIPVPKEITIVDLGENNVLLTSRDNSFFIVHFDNYSLRLNGKEILSFTNQRQHSIRGSEIVKEISV